MNSIKLHSVVEFVRNGATIKQDKNSSLGIPITRIETISNSVFNYDRLGYANVQDDTYSNYYLYDKDVLLSHINSEKFLGRSVLYKLEPTIAPIIHGMNLLCIRFHKEVYNPAFFVWYSKSDIAKDYFKIHTKRAVNQASITSTAIKEMPIPDVNINEQNAIVSELDKIQAALDNKKEQLKKLDVLIQSKFYEMFGDPVVNEKGWDIKELGEICELKAGKNIKASELYEIQSDGLYPCYGGNGLRGYINKYSHQGTFSLIGRQGALCGNVKLAKGLFYATEHAVVVTPRIEINALYVYYVLTFLELNRYAKGVAQPGISVQVINGVYFPLPPLPLQQAFAAYVEKVEQAKAIVNQEIAHLQELLDSRMDFYFHTKTEM